MLLSRLVLLMFIHIAQTARILIVIPSPSLSHNIFYRPLFIELAKTHDVVLITADTIKDPNLTNLTEIDIHDSAYSALPIGQILLEKSTGRKIQKFYQGLPYMVNVIEVIFTNPAVQTAFNQTYDLIIVEHFYYNGIYALQKFHTCPMIAITSTDLTALGYDALGSSTFPSYYVDWMMPSGMDLTFWERLDNFVFALEVRWFYYWKMIPAHEELVERVFGLKVDLVEAEGNIELVLVNSNPIFHNPRPLMPGMIEIGGMHAGIQDQTGNKMNQDLKSFLDKSHQGVIYFSLGSNIKSKNLPPEIFNALIKAFSSTPYNILWKFEQAELPNKPKNVFIQQWLPQPEVLNHANVRVFVMQGGLQSIEESIQAKVPVLVIPFGGDQHYNARRVASLQIGLTLSFHDLTSELLVETFSELMENEIYRDRIGKISDLLWDQPMKPLDKAVWWIEYVIRHGGAKHLRSPAADMSWFKLFSLDVIVFLVGSALTVSFILGLVIKGLFKLVTKTSSNKQKLL